MKSVFILNSPPYGDERSYNGLRLAGALARREGGDVRVFLDLAISEAKAREELAA